MSSTETQHEAPTPTREHKWLQKLIGEWRYETDAAPPGMPPQKLTGTETVRAIGDLWVVAEGRGQTPGGGEATTLLTLGYDPDRARFVGTWIGSMMTYLWVYDGGLDPSERILTLGSEGPSFEAPDTTASYRDIIEFRSDDHRILRGEVLGRDDQWSQMMTVDYYRVG